LLARPGVIGGQGAYQGEPARGGTVHAPVLAMANCQHFRRVAFGRNRVNQRALSANQNLWLVSQLATAHNTPSIVVASPRVRATQRLQANTKKEA
jgi:hypothetical protein